MKKREKKYVPKMTLAEMLKTIEKIGRNAQNMKIWAAVDQ